MRFIEFSFDSTSGTIKAVLSQHNFDLLEIFSQLDNRDLELYRSKKDQLLGEGVDFANAERLAMFDVLRKRRQSRVNLPFIRFSSHSRKKPKVKVVYVELWTEKYCVVEQLHEPNFDLLDIFLSFDVDEFSHYGELMGKSHYDSGTPLMKAERNAVQQIWQSRLEYEKSLLDESQDDWDTIS